MEWMKWSLIVLVNRMCSMTSTAYRSTHGTSRKNSNLSTHKHRLSGVISPNPLTKICYAAVSATHVAPANVVLAHIPLLISLARLLSRGDALHDHKVGARGIQAVGETRQAQHCGRTGNGVQGGIAVCPRLRIPLQPLGSGKVGAEFQGVTRIGPFIAFVSRTKITEIPINCAQSKPTCKRAACRHCAPGMWHW